MPRLEDVPQENLDQIGQLFAQARARMRKTQQDVSRETEVSPGLISLLERSGPFPGLRAFEFLKLIEYYKLNVNDIASLLGIQLYDINTTQESPFASQARIIASLPPNDRDWIVEVVDALLRGMREPRM